ncbi:MAG: protein kinase [Planctomycetes bacterium]|nr:protein kinase [Planctomycetota bacterium]
MTIDPIKAKELFLQALDRQEPADRDRFLCEACGDDAALRHEVNVLLSAEAGAGSFLEQGVVATIDQPHERPGTMIGPYKLLEQIGEGGMGLVYMAEQLRPVRRLVALKIIKPGMDSKQVIARFEAERQALAMMDHPNIAKVLDAGTTEAGRPYFIMELVRGIPINEFCDEKRLTVHQRLELFVQVCQAVQHAHQKGIIHRDLKPTNVLVTMHDTVSVPKIIDFGIAKALGLQLTERTLHTGFAQLVGTPLYMSPEQAEMNQLGVDTRSDVYSLGVMLYELLTGSTPFDKETLTKSGLDEMRRIIREQEPLRPSARISTLQGQALSTVSDRRSTDPRRITTMVRGELDWIVIRALEKERNRRYESASAFAVDIQRYLSDEPVQACPPSAAYYFRKLAHKHRVALTTAALIAASLLLGTVISVWQAIRATAAEAQAGAKEAEALAAQKGEAAQRQQAEASEQRAKDRLVEVERQRMQAERNFQAALGAVNRMLAHVNDPELRDIPRVGPVKRKILKDAVDFYGRIPVQRDASPETRIRIAETWHRIAHLSWSLNEWEQANLPFKTALAMLSQLVAEHPNEVSYRANLADAEYWAGTFHQSLENEQRDVAEAERLLRNASERFGQLAEMDQTQPWRNWHARSLIDLARILRTGDRADEAYACLTRALKLLDASPAEIAPDRARILVEMAFLQSKVNQAESDDLFRRGIAAYRKYAAEHKGKPDGESMLAGALWIVSGMFFGPHPDEAEKYLDESIVLMREIAERLPDRQSDLFYLIRSLVDQARHQRRLAIDRATSEDPERIASRIAKAYALFEDGIAKQRQLVSRFTLRGDRYRLVEILHEQSEYLLGRMGIPLPQANDACQLEADALLTEAIQLCRQLAAEFPDDAQYRDRLTALLKLQAEHFGQRDEVKSPNP